MKAETALIIRDADLESWDDHIEAWHRLGRFADGAAWGRARIAASVKKHAFYGDQTIKKFAEELRFSEASIYNFINTFETFPELSNRLENLTFTHHLDAVRFTDSPKAAIAALEKAEREGWQVPELRRYLRQSKQLAAAPALPEGVFSTLVIDPPWLIEKIDREVRPKQAAVDYPMMTLEELAALPVLSKAADNAHLYLWTTHKYLPDALSLAETWGFRYQCLLTWVKNVGMTPFSWMYSTEHVLFCRRGSLDLLRKGLRLDFKAKVTRHSEKPEEFYELVRQASPEPRIEFFARKTHEGFTPWGNEVEATGT